MALHENQERLWQEMVTANQDIYSCAEDLTENRPLMIDVPGEISTVADLEKAIDKMHHDSVFQMLSDEEYREAKAFVNEYIRAVPNADEVVKRLPFISEAWGSVVMLQFPASGSEQDESQ